MLARHRRLYSAKKIDARVIVGSTKWWATSTILTQAPPSMVTSCMPATGNSGTSKEKAINSMMPVQNTGAEKPNRANKVTA